MTLLAFVAAPALALLHDERGEKPDAVSDLVLPNLVASHGRKRVEGAVLAGLRSADELTSLMERPIDEPSAIIWPRLRVTGSGVAGPETGHEQRLEDYNAAWPLVFDPTFLDGEGFQPFNMLVIMAPAFFETDGYDERLAWASEAEPETAELLARTVPSPNGCGGRLVVNTDGFVEAAIILADSELLSQAEMVGCIRDRMFAAAGFAPYRIPPTDFSPDERYAISVAATNAIYQCATTEQLKSYISAFFDAERTNAFPSAGCIIGGAVTMLGSRE